ncbi:hypothetical protein GEV33_013995 [Tenebrio molitor]|uniref:C2H2-type domain-containing protein n=1 Tax=Tenebrio molitor TaxID=7067 RepID=A0A8J6H6K1_TENMO|nr:hypothetical protein GEV33_013995 [Tenebrio molitor]
MQSQLEAALLGRSSNVNTSSNLDDDENNFHDEEGEDVEDFADEDLEGDNGSRGGKHATGSSTTPRTVTLQMLLSADILQPGKGTMTIEYLGQKFVGDLLEDGKIRSQETDIVFASPSAWAIACKRFINPEKKSGCGWASVKYRGRKLDAYKNVWYRKKKEERNQEFDGSSELEHLIQTTMTNSMQYHRIVVKHNTIANRTLTQENAHHIEAEISKAIEKEKLTLVGWYHSHPFAAAAPTLRDVDAQLDYQIRMKGTSDNNYTPCIGIIISPYNYENNSLESSIIAYWVIPPPETKPNEYGRPMLMSYSVIQDSLITSNVKEEIKKCVEYYKKEPDFINFRKFPTPSSLLGLPDPMAHSTLAANNMFLSTNLFKMQELLKPLSTSSPLPTKTKSDQKHCTALKIPSDIKGITKKVTEKYLKGWNNVYECHNCKKQFIRGGLLTKHLMKVHNYHWPSGHSRFRYKEDQDGIYRLQTVRYETLDVTEAIIKGNTVQAPTEKEPLQFDLLKRQSDDNSVDTFDVVLCEETEKETQVEPRKKVVITIDDIDLKGNVLKSQTIQSGDIISEDMKQITTTLTFVNPEEKSQESKHTP